MTGSVNSFVLEFDRERAVEIFRYIANAWEKRFTISPFPPLISPEVRFLPKEMRSDKKLHGTLEHAYLLFWFGFLNRNGDKADRLISSASKLWQTNPDLIDPRVVSNFQPSDLEPLRNIIPFAFHQNHRHRIEWWVKCLRLIHEEYNDDPRSILTRDLYGDPMADRDMIIKRFSDKRFIGIGPKIAQLIIGWYQENIWYDHPAQWDYIRKIPVIAADIWMGRLFRQFDLVTLWSSDHSQSVMYKIADFASIICLEEGINHNNLAQGLWHLGAKICGKQRPRNLKKAFAEFCPNCPAAAFCHGVVPANYVIKEDDLNNRGSRSSRRISPLRWDDRIDRPIEIQHKLKF